MTDEPADVPAQVRFAVSSFAPYMGFNWKWHEGPIDGNYDPDANLSVTLHTVEYATVSSPTQIALYHKGEYKGQGTPIAGAFISVRRDECTDDTVAIRIRIPGESHVDAKSLHNVNFTWRDGRIYWSGDWPVAAAPLPSWIEANED
jgi:hypothetical protein